MFEVILKTHHPIGTYHRAGLEFNRNTPVRLETVPDAVRKDPWLVVTRVAAVKTPAPMGSGDGDENRKDKGKDKD